MKQIAVAILNWNGKKWLEKFLPIVEKYSPQAQIYVIDNASTDDSVAFVEHHFSNVKIIKLAENKGFTGGYNEGLKFISEDIYCLLNSDVEVTENWLNPILGLFSRDESISAVQPKILSYSNKKYFEFAGAGGGLIDNLGYPYCRGRVFETLEQDNGQYDDEVEIFWASGCAMFVRREDFWSVGGFDNDFFAHQEEIDLCWRLKNKGKKIYYTGQSVVYHVGGGTLNNQNPKKTFLNIKNNMMMLMKNLPFPEILWILPVRFILDLIGGIYLCYKKGISHFFSILKAYFVFLLKINTTIKKREKYTKKKYYQSKYIVYKYFIKGKKIKL